MSSSGLGGCHASVHEGTPYPCTQHHIERTCRVSRHERHGERVTPERALEDLAHFNRLDRRNPAAVNAAVTRIRKAIARCMNHTWERDIIIKVYDFRSSSQIWSTAPWLVAVLQIDLIWRYLHLVIDVNRHNY